MLPSWTRSSSDVPGAAVPLGDRDDESQVGLDQRRLGCLAVLDQVGQVGDVLAG